LLTKERANSSSSSEAHKGSDSAGGKADDDDDGFENFGFFSRPLILLLSKVESFRVNSESGEEATERLGGWIIGPSCLSLVNRLGEGLRFIVVLVVAVIFGFDGQREANDGGPKREAKLSAGGFGSSNAGAGGLSFSFRDRSSACRAASVAISGEMSQ